MPESPTGFNPLLCEEHAQDLDKIVTRVQKLVDDYHAANVTVATIRGEIAAISSRVPIDLPTQLATLRGDILGLSARVPANLPEQLATMREQVRVASEDISGKDGVKAGLKTLTPYQEFTLLRTQVYAFAFIIISSVVSGIMLAIFKGAFKP